MDTNSTIATQFQSTLPAWGETYVSAPCGLALSISIHSPRMGRDSRSRRSSISGYPFQSTLPAWGETSSPTLAPLSRPFQSTLPAWGETVHAHQGKHLLNISIHSPRMGRDLYPWNGIHILAISIHSPRMGRDGAGVRLAVQPLQFQSTLPAWGETLAEEISAYDDKFQSTLPAWGETNWESGKTTPTTEFQSTLPAWGETEKYHLQPITIDISIHSPRMGRDDDQDLSGQYAEFQSTLPAWGETAEWKRSKMPKTFQSTLPAWGETAEALIRPCR